MHGTSACCPHCNTPTVPLTKRSERTVRVMWGIWNPISVFTAPLDPGHHSNVNTGVKTPRAAEYHIKERINHSKIHCRLPICTKLRRKRCKYIYIMWEIQLILLRCTNFWPKRRWMEKRNTWCRQGQVGHVDEELKEFGRTQCLRKEFLGCGWNLWFIVECWF